MLVPETTNPGRCLACYMGEHEDCRNTFTGEHCSCECVAARVRANDNRYRTLGECLAMSSDSNRSKIMDLYEDLLADPELAKAAGSSQNHQAWEGGYFDHVREAVNVAYRIYYFAFGSGIARHLPFTFAEAVDVLLLHDIEKPWKTDPRYKLLSKEERGWFRIAKIREYGIVLSPMQDNAIEYCEGEYKNYSSHERRMNDLAAFCNMCDVASARIWHDKGRECNW